MASDNIKRHVSHVKSNRLNGTNPVLPTSGDILHGEIAVNYATGYETLAIRNDSNHIITFSSDGYMSKAITNAINALDATKSGNSTHVGVSVSEADGKITGVSVSETGITDYNTFTAHTASSVHMSNTEKTNLDSLATNIATISAITSTKVSNWDTAYNNNHTHSNKSYLDNISGNLGSMAYESTSSYSSATQVYNALANKADKSEIPSLAGYATQNWVQQQGYLTSASLNGYATETWVNNKGYITSSALDNYLPLSGGTLTGTLTMSGGSYGYGSIYVNSDGLVLSSNASDQIFLNAGNVYCNLNLEVDDSLSVNGDISVGDDVTATRFIKKNGTSSGFLKADGSVDTHSYLTSLSLGGLSDVSISSVGEGNILVYNGSGWVNTSWPLNGYATKDWVENKGYITSEGSCAYASNAGTASTANNLSKSASSGDLLVNDGGSAWVTVNAGTLISSYMGSYLPKTGATLSSKMTLTCNGGMEIIGNGNDITINTSSGSQSNHGKLNIGTYVNLSAIPTSSNNVQDYEMWIDSQGYVRRRGYNGADNAPVIQYKSSSFTIQSGLPVFSMYFCKNTTESSFKVYKPSGETLIYSDSIDPKTEIEIGVYSMLFVKVTSTKWVTFWCQ